jgi:zinc transport system permease protein
MLVVPVAASMQISKSFKSTMLNAVVFGMLAVILGLVFSYYFNLAPGGTIVLFSVALLLLVIATKKYIFKSVA